MLLYRHFGVGGVLFYLIGGKVKKIKKEITADSAPGLGNSFSAIFNLQLVKNPAVMPFNGLQGEIEPLADRPVREPMGNEFEDLQLTLAQRFD